MFPNTKIFLQINGNNCFAYSGLTNIVFTDLSFYIDYLDNINYFDSFCNYYGNITINITDTAKILTIKEVIRKFNI